MEGVAHDASVDACDFVSRARSVLARDFGFGSFRDGQLRVIEALGAGRDCLVIMPTGSGKSLCYQVPALVLEGATLVVSPLIALMKDQVDALARRGIPATYVNSSLSTEEQWRRLEGLGSGAYRLVYVAPERFRSGAFRRVLDGVRLSLLAVDEAHCISQWGHDFRPDYRRLSELRTALGNVQAIALTATATPEVQQDIVRQLGMRDPERVVTGFDRPNLTYGVKKVKGGDRRKDEALDEFLSERIERSRRERGIAPSGIVYVGTRRHAEEVADRLAALDPGSARGGTPLCRAYHAGLPDHVRREVQEAFMSGRLPWVAATNAFGMGVDKPDIRHVVHYDLPGSVEAYYQEVGRAGRDGEPAECLLLFAEQDRRLQEFFIEGMNPGRKVIESAHDFLRELGENPILRPLVDLETLFRSLRPELGASGLAFRSALVVLERAGAIDRLDHGEQLAVVAPREGTEWSRNPYSARATRRRPFWDALQRVFARTDGQPASIRLEHWARDLETDVESLRRTISEVVDDGWVLYTPPFRGRAIRLPERPACPLPVDFEALVKKRRREEERLERMIGFARSRACRRDYVLAYFGEAVPSRGCGSCDRCAGRRVAARGARPLSDEEFTVVQKVLSGVARASGRCGAGRVVQMLRGSRAQGLPELGLDRLSTYGILKGVKAAVIRDVVGLLEDAGCIERSTGRYPVIRLTPKGVRVMTDRERVELAFPRLRRDLLARVGAPHRTGAR